MNLQRDSSHQGLPYHQSQEALSVPSKALKPEKLRSSSCLPHRNHFSLHLSFKRRHHLVCASFERATIIPPDHWAVAALGWSGVGSTLFFWAVPTSLEITLETEVIICSREPNRRFLIPQWKSGKVTSWSQIKKLLFLREKRIWWGEKWFSKDGLWFKTRSYKEEIFLDMSACSAWHSPREQHDLCSIWELSELFIIVCYNFLTPSHILFK